jgi:hypothetical protein
LSDFWGIATLAPQALTVTQTIENQLLKLTAISKQILNYVLYHPVLKYGKFCNNRINCAQPAWLCIRPDFLKPLRCA